MKEMWWLLACFDTQSRAGVVYAEVAPAPGKIEWSVDATSMVTRGAMNNDAAPSPTNRRISMALL